MIINQVTLLNETTLESFNDSKEVDIIKRFTEVGIKILGADFGFAWLDSPPSKDLNLVYKSPRLPFIPHPPRKNGRNYSAIKKATPHFVSETSKTIDAFYVSKHIKSFVIIPIVYKKTVYGSMVLCFKKPEFFPKDKRVLSVFIGNSVTQAMTISRLVLRESGIRILSRRQGDHFRALIEDISEVVIHMNKDGKVLYVNPSVEKIFNVKAKDAVGKNIGDFIYNAKDRVMALNYIKRILKKPDIVDRITEFSYKHKDGSELFLDCTGANIAGDENMKGVVINIRDVTERKALALAKETNKLLEEEKFKMQSIADTTHELRTPLAIIKGNVDLGVKKLKSTKSVFSDINQEVDYLSSIVSDLAMITSVGMQLKNKVNFKEVNLKELILNAATRGKVLARKRNISIKISSLPNITIVGDKFYLEKMFINLIRNSIIYGKRGGRTEINLKKSKGFIEINIIDNGIGIAIEDMPHVFERFFKADKSHTYTESSTGLGLSIVKWIAEVHGGAVSAESKDGKGSVFSVTLPIKVSKSLI